MVTAAGNGHSRELIPGFAGNRVISRCITRPRTLADRSFPGQV
jgi:hypothetical protein